VLSTVMQVAGAVGVAVVGVVFFNTLGTGGFPHAFAASLTFLTCVEVATAALVQLVPKPAVPAG
ncbi:MAG TPA: MFS transporter, partial [Actinomycetes bacterium]|nr:MFS transporter [Actinomycetes bacterium]